MILVILCLTFLILFMLLSRKEKVEELTGNSSILRPFYQMGQKLAGILFSISFFQKDVDKLRLLHPAADYKKEARYQLTKKLALSLMTIFIGCIFILLLQLKNQGNQILKAGNVMQRPEYKEGSYTAELTVGTEEGWQRDISVEIEERQFTEDEIRELLPIFYEELERAVLGENESADCVNRDLSLPERIAGFPFQIQWDRPGGQALDRRGKILDEVAMEGEIVVLSAQITYGDYSYLYSFPLHVFPKYMEEEEMLFQNIQTSLSDALNESVKEEQVILPEEVGGIKVIWQEKKKENTILFFGFVIGAGIALFWGQGNDLKQKLRDREEEMILDYPEIISKLTLYIGAGMTVRGAWKKMAIDYGKKKERDGKARYIYEEMLFTLYEMESGISEVDAYQRFANRCHVQKYVKLMAMLEQNVRLGSKGLLQELKKEAAEAFEERKSIAKQMGEKAGSKLMLPMFLMLGIVMVVIMVPSFLSIGM